MEKILVSACLLGKNCKYNGGNNRNEEVIEHLKELGYEIVPVCPEVYGGLPIPHAPSEIIGDKVVSKEGMDVTAEFLKGGKKTVEMALKNQCTKAVLKERSPSCGSGMIYDGTFSGQLTRGDGIAAGLLKQEGVHIYGESRVKELPQAKA